MATSENQNEKHISLLITQIQEQIVCINIILL